ncbi:MAG: cytochrome c [Acidobacteriota bacterium]
MIFQARGRPLSELLTGPLLSLFGLLMLSFSTVSHAQQESRSGKELYIDRLGCWGCHGRAGEGGDGPALRNTRLPLWKFVKQLRLPSETMPPFAHSLVSDADLAIVYDWLDGADTVEIPPPVAVILEGPGQVTAKTEVQLTVRTVAANLNTALPDPAPWRYRVTLLRRDNTPVAHATLEHRLAGREWLEFTTDERGQAVLGPDQGFLPADGSETEKGATTRLRIASLPANRYAFVVEAIDGTESANPVVLGIGTGIFTVE